MPRTPNPQSRRQQGTTRVPVEYTEAELTTLDHNRKGIPRATYVRRMSLLDVKE